MAESILSTLSKDFLTCNICIEIYREPKILSCLHSFCKECIEKELAKSNDKNYVSCPLCREITLLREDGIVGLKTNFFIVNLTDFSESTTAQFRDNSCTYCKLLEVKNPAHGKCLTCGDYLCQACYDRHTFTTETFGHEIVTFQNLQSGRYNEKLRSSQEIPCQKHTKEFLRYFCDTCNVPVCRDCVILSHRQDHDIVPPSKAIEKSRQKIGQLLEDLDKKMVCIKANVEILKEKDRELVSTERKISETMLETVNKLVEKIQTEGQASRHLLQAFINSRREELARKKSEEEEKLKLLGKSMEFCRKVIDNGMEGEIVFLQDVIQERLTYLDAFVYDADKLEPMTPPSLVISEKAEECSSLNLFKFEFPTKMPDTFTCVRGKSTKVLIEETEGNQISSLLNAMVESSSDCQNIESNGHSLLKVKSNEISTFPKYAIIPCSKDQRTVSNKEQCSNLKDENLATTLFFRHECFINCKIDGDVCKPKLTSVTWLNKESFVVVDETNEKIKQFNMKGKLLNSTAMESVLTVAYADKLIYCGLKSGQIKLLNTKFEILDDASQRFGYYIPVSIGKKRPRVLYLGHTSLHHINKSTETIESHSLVDKSGRKVRLHPMYPHRFGEHELVVSDWYSASVYVIKSDGTVSNTYSKKYDVNWKPGGLCCDKDDNIYIADYPKRELVVLNSRCEYITTIKLPNIQCPRSLACSLTNKVLFTFKEGVSLFQILKSE